MGNFRTSPLPPDPNPRLQAAPGPREAVPGGAREGYTTGYTGQYADEVEKGSLLDYWRVLSRRKMLLLSLAAGGALAGIFASFAQSPVYQARARIEMEDLNREFLNMKQASPVEDPSSTNSAGDLPTQIQILQSETLIDKTLNRLGITTRAQLDPKTKGIKRPESGNETRGQLIEAAGKNLKVAAAGQTRLIEITYQSTDPKVAAGFANALAAEFIDQKLQTRGQVNEHTAAWMADQLAELRSNLQRSEEAMQNYAQKNGLVYTGDKERASGDRLREMQTQMAQAEGELSLKGSRLKTATTVSPSTLPDVLNDGNLRALQNKLTDLKKQQAELAMNYTPEHYEVKKNKAEMEVVEAALERERGQIVSRISNDYVEAEQREAALKDAYNKQSRRVMQDSRKSVEYENLKREVDTNRQVYEAMMQRLKESTVTSALKPANIRVIDPARVPEKPFKPSLPLNTAGGLMGGLMLGVAGVVIGARADRRLHQPGDAGRLLGLPELGVVPSTTLNGKRLASLTGGLGARPDNAAKTAELRAWQTLHTGLVDSFRSVLASIMFSQGDDLRGVFAITSAGPSEGKTTTATNLAVAMAKIGRQVLLIDGDIRKPAVHQAFGLSNEHGLTDLMNQIILDGAAADSALRRTSFPDLFVLTSGPSIQTGCDLLFNASMPRLLTHYKRHFDMILIDTPPLLHMPDARVLGRQADGVVLVTRAGRTLREAAVAACERLAQDRTPVLGVILNDWDPKSAPYGYYGKEYASVAKKYGSRN